MYRAPVVRMERRNDIAGAITSATSAPVQSSYGMVRVFNTSGALAYVRAVETGGTVTAANGMPIAAGGVEWMLVSRGQSVAGILASGTGTIAITEHGL